MGKARNSGLGLIEVIIAATISGMVLLGVVALMTNTFKAQQFAQMKDEFSSVRRSITSAMRCAQTVAAPAVCDGTTPIVLRDATGIAITPGAFLTSGPFAGAAKLGDYYIKATCSNVDKTITVRVARGTPDGSAFAEDSLTKRPFNFDRPPNPIFGPLNPLCQEALGGSSIGQNCPVNQVMVGINPDGSPKCNFVGTVIPMPTCPANNAMTGINPDGSARCVALGTIPPATTCGAREVMKGIRADGSPNCVLSSESFMLTAAQLATGHPVCPPTGPTTWTQLLGCMNAAANNCAAMGFAGGTLNGHNTAQASITCTGSRY